jgi:Transposase IS116/IS110/IS902 family
MWATGTAAADDTTDADRTPARSAEGHDPVHPARASRTAVASTNVSLRTGAASRVRSRATSWRPRDAAADDHPRVDMVVAVGLRAAIGPSARLQAPDRLVSYLGRNPTVHPSGEGRPRHGRISEQGHGRMRAPCSSRRPGRLSAERGRCGRSTSGRPGAGAYTSPPSQCPASLRASFAICCSEARIAPGYARRGQRGSASASNLSRTRREERKQGK